MMQFDNEHSGDILTFASANIFGCIPELMRLYNIGHGTKHAHDKTMI